MSAASRAAADVVRPLTKAEAAKALRCSERTVQRRVAAGELESIRDSAKRLLFLPEFITDYLERHTTPAAPRTSKSKRNPKYA